MFLHPWDPPPHSSWHSMLYFITVSALLRTRNMCRLTRNIQDIGKFCHSFEPFTCASYFSNVLIAKDGFTLVQSASKSGPPCLQGHLELVATLWRCSQDFLQIALFPDSDVCNTNSKGSASLIAACNTHLLINMFSYWLALQPEWQVSINLGLSIKMITFWCIYLHLMILIIIP